MLRGIDPDVIKANLAAILEKLKDRNIKVLFAGMLASPSLGKDYKAKFDALFPASPRDMARRFFPFFLDGVAGQPKLTLSDGLHPSAAGRRDNRAKYPAQRSRPSGGHRAQIWGRRLRFSCFSPDAIFFGGEIC